MHQSNKPDYYTITPHLLTKSNPTPKLHLPSHEIIAPSYTPTAEFYSAERSTLRHDVYSRSSNASSHATSRRTLSSCIGVSSKQDTYVSSTTATNQITTQLRLTYSPNLIQLKNYNYLLTKSFPNRLQLHANCRILVSRENHSPSRLMSIAVQQCKLTRYFSTNTVFLY